MLQIRCWNRPDTPLAAFWNGSHLILFHRVKWQHDMLFNSVTFGYGKPADWSWCEEYPCYYEAPPDSVCVGSLSDSIMLVTNTAKRKIAFMADIWCLFSLVHLSAPHFLNHKTNSNKGLALKNTHCSLNIVSDHLNVISLAVVFYYYYYY